MYRIELAPGEEAALRNVDELAAGIRTGVITSRARIWHNAGRKWLPIEFHPHYQVALKRVETESLPATAAAFPAATTHCEPPGAPAERASEPSVDTIVAKADTTADARVPATAPGIERRSFRRPLVLAVAGAALIASARVVASATSADEAPSSVAHMGATVARPDSAPAPRPTIDAVTPNPVPAAPLSSVGPTLEPAPAAKAASAPHAVGGGVVRGPDPSASLPAAPPASKPSASDEPEIAPAPVVTELPMPALPTDSAN